MSLVARERRDGVAVLALDRPRANAFSPELVADLARAVAEHADADAIVLTSKVPGMFSAGWDLPALVSRPRREFELFVDAYNDVVRTLFAHPKPVVAALPGHAIAGGLIVAAAADERIGAEGRGELGLSEVLLGVPVPKCLFEPFRHAIGPRAAERLAATGENLSMEKALAVGMVDRVVPADRLEAEAHARARTLASRPPAAHAAIKRHARAEALARFDQGRKGDPFFDVWFTDDAQARIRALVDRLAKK